MHYYRSVCRIFSSVSLKKKMQLKILTDSNNPQFVHLQMSQRSSEQPQHATQVGFKTSSVHHSAHTG